MKPSPQTITAEYVREILDYSPETGIFIRKKSDIRFVGKPAGRTDQYGYRVIKIGARQHYAHRLAWLWIHGEWPHDFYIDHINLDRGDNRLCNLRKATHGQNAANSKPRCKSGVKGVYPAPRMPNKWQAHLNIDGKTTVIGTFNSIEEADAAYRQAATAKYGEFARFD